MEQEKKMNEQNLDAPESVENDGAYSDDAALEHSRSSKWDFLKRIWGYLTGSVKRIACFAGVSAAVLAVAVFFLTVSLHQPVKIDESSGIAISVPRNAVSSFQKLGLEFHVEELTVDSQIYTETKVLISKQSENFVLYDFALLKNGQEVSFDEEVTVDVPIPAGFDASRVGVLHVISDSEFEVIPSTVSEDGSTVSFSTPHFSFYAIAELHQPVIVAGKPATCTESGLTDGSQCGICGLTIAQQEVIPAKGHTEVVISGQSATCTSTGLTEGRKCSVCDEILLEQQIIPMTAHTETPGDAVVENLVEATCKTTGSYDEVVYCADCHEELSRITHVINKTDSHIAGTAVVENKVDSTCKEEGSYDEVVYCSICDHEMSRTTMSIPVKTEHTPGLAVEENKIDSTCKEEGSYD